MVAFDAVGPGSSGVSFTVGVASWAHINSAASNAIVVCLTYITGTSPPVTAVTYGSTSLSRLGTVPANNVGPGGADMWGAIGGLQTGSNTVTLTNPGYSGGNHICCGSMSFKTGATGLQFGTVFTNFANAASVSLNVTGTTSGNQIASCCSYGGTGLGTITANSPGTLQYFCVGDVNTGADNGAGQSCASPGGTQAVGFTVAAGGDFWGIIAVEVQDTSAAVAQPPSPLYQMRFIG